MFYEEGTHLFRAVYDQQGNFLMQNLFEQEKLSFDEFRKKSWDLVVCNHFCYYEPNESGVQLLEIGDATYQIDPRTDARVYNFFQDVWCIMYDYGRTGTFSTDVNEDEIPNFLEAYQNNMKEISQRRALQKVYHLEDNFRMSDLKQKLRSSNKKNILISIGATTLLNQMILNALPVSEIVRFCLFALCFSGFLYYNSIRVAVLSQFAKQTILKSFLEVKKEYELKEREKVARKEKDHSEHFELVSEKESSDIFWQDIEKNFENLSLLVNQLSGQKRSQYLQKLRELNQFYFDHMSEIRASSSNRSSVSEEANLFNFMQNRFWELLGDIRSDLEQESNLQDLSQRKQKIEQLLQDASDDRIDEPSLTLDVSSPVLDVSGRQFTKELTPPFSNSPK